MKRFQRKICLVSGKRGGFGAYLPLMQLIEKDPELELQILLTDMHASSKFGRTATEVEKFFPHAIIQLLSMGSNRGDSSLIRASNLANLHKKVIKALDELKPDLVMVHGDRGEHLVTAFVALNLGIPVAHTQGGDISGNIDDIQRHAISKIAHLHFPETKEAADRLKKIGEEAWRIHVVGSTYIDRIIKGIYTSPKVARKKYGLAEDDEYSIILFHPDTFLRVGENYSQMKIIIDAAKGFPMKYILLYPCSDPGHDEIIKAIRECSDDNRFIIRVNIDNLDFLGLMKGAKMIIGNSSCALVEAPYLKLPAINIGNRQVGRARGGNVIDAKPTTNDISIKISYALTNKGFQHKVTRSDRRLGNGRAAEKIVQVLKSININEKLMRKRLHFA